MRFWGREENFWSDSLFVYRSVWGVRASIGSENGLGPLGSNVKRIQFSCFRGNDDPA